MVPEAGDEDPEHPASNRDNSVGHLQARLTALTDDCVAEGLLESLRVARRWPDVTRIQEISHEDCSHEWLWYVDPNKGPVMSHSEYINAVRLRLSAGGLDDPVICGSCNTSTLDTSAAHALCCASGPSTRGHYRVCDKLHEVARACDAGAETEPVGLIASHPALRPADILTSAAISGRLAALDVGIVAPEASGAGLDCVAAMHARKQDRYLPHQAELERANVQYVPMVWSAFGRPHAQTSTIIRQLAKKVARRRGLLNASLFERRAHAKIGVEIWRRAARMVMACLPRAPDEELQGEGDQVDLGKAEPPHQITA